MKTLFSFKIVPLKFFNKKQVLTANYEADFLESSLTRRALPHLSPFQHIKNLKIAINPFKKFFIQYHSPILDSSGAHGLKLIEPGVFATVEHRDISPNLPTQLTHRPS